MAGANPVGVALGKGGCWLVAPDLHRTNGGRSEHKIAADAPPAYPTRVGHYLLASLVAGVATRRLPPAVSRLEYSQLYSRDVPRGSLWRVGDRGVQSLLKRVRGAGAAGDGKGGWVDMGGCAHVPRCLVNRARGCCPIKLIFGPCCRRCSSIYRDDTHSLRGKAWYAPSHSLRVLSYIEVHRNCGVSIDSLAACGTLYRRHCGSAIYVAKKPRGDEEVGMLALI